MKVVALISGGKDSCYNMMQCVAEGHQIVAIANLKPKHKDELDSYMYQTVGHHAINLYAEAMGLPLYRREIEGSSQATGRDYQPTHDDEVEDLYELLKTVKAEQDVEGVAVGAILSNYQRVRVENVCGRLGLTALAFLWRRDQVELLEEMIQCRVNAVLIKVAAMGLYPKKHLGKSLSEMQDYLLKKSTEFDLNVCGEGGEFETFTLDCPLFNKAIVLDEVETVIHSDDAFAPVGYLNIRKAHLEDKPLDPSSSPQSRLEGLPMKRSSDLMQEMFPGQSELSCDECQKLQSSHSAPICDKLSVRSILQVDSSSQTSGNHLWLTNLIAYIDNGPDIASQTQTLMVNLQDTLTSLDDHWSLADLVLVHLYVRDMADFAAVNAVYKKYFGLNPAARVCVQTDLPDNVSLMMDCYGNSNQSDRDTMHVQGLSHWAPANIGPYSQCVRVQNRLYVAGQIGMVPTSLAMVEGGVRAQARLSLRHVARVLAAMVTNYRLDNLVTCVCYLTHSSYISVAKEELQGTAPEGVCCTPLYVVVPVLPKSALIEWQVVAHIEAGGHKTTVHREMKTRGALECVLTSHKLPHTEDGHPGSISITAHVYSRTKCDLDPKETVDLLLSCWKAAVQDTENQSLCEPFIGSRRVFYPASLFAYEQLYEALKSHFEEEPFSLVPVTQLETCNLILALAT
ncbi:uncharacterized protein LOC128209374 isoform X2 [Mya arenaria]|uniref:uncharacterized protein LOC128209374 isoform X2 n=1 Tax=Mya arenaria TaxID=6604 RepID=UPI0022E358DA|nr:uncharacterized protein LOC128209374 isoform X2 [Mya arenaria]